MEKKEIDKNIRTVFIQYGVVLGIVYLAFTIISYYVITSGVRSPFVFVGVPVLFRLFVPVLLTLFLGFRGRKRIGGLWTFKQATTGVFIMFLVAFLIQFAGKDLLFDRVIEPNSIQKTQVATVNARTQNLKQKGYDQKTIDKTLDDMRKDLATQTNATTVGGFVSEITISIIFIFVFALVFAAFFRNAEYVKADGGS